MCPSLQVELRGANRRLQRLRSRGLEQPLLFELEALELKLPLLREEAALHVERAVAAFGRSRFGIHQRALALELGELELMLLQPLLDLETMEPLRILRREVRLPRAQALLEPQIERVLVLLEMQPAVIGVVCRVRDAGEAKPG